LCNWRINDIRVAVNDDVHLVRTYAEQLHQSVQLETNIVIQVVCDQP